MKLKDVAAGYLRQAKLRLKTAKRALKEKEFAYCIRQTQESVELALKGALNWINIEYPYYHDVGPVLVANKNEFPAWFSAGIEDFAKTSRELARKRELAMYGEETKGLAPEKLFNQKEAKRALETAGDVFSSVQRLIQE